VVQHDGQDYRLIGSRLHVKLDGTPISLLVWETDCPVCGDEFEVLTTLRFRGPKRFCDGCRETISQRTVKAWRKKEARARRQSLSEVPEAAAAPSAPDSGAEPEPQESR
jgi:hypothetical protein